MSSETLDPTESLLTPILMVHSNLCDWTHDIRFCVQTIETQFNPVHGQQNWAQIDRRTAYAAYQYMT